jgi:hypothetical protein
MRTKLGSWWCEYYKGMGYNVLEASHRGRAELYSETLYSRESLKKNPGCAGKRL